MYYSREFPHWCRYTTDSVAHRHAASAVPVEQEAVWATQWAVGCGLWAWRREWQVVWCLKVPSGSGLPAGYRPMSRLQYSQLQYCLSVLLLHRACCYDHFFYSNSCTLLITLVLKMCFVWISEQTAIISLYNINWLVFITETESVYCAVRTGSLYKTQINICL